VFKFEKDLSGNKTKAIQYSYSIFKLL